MARGGGFRFVSAPPERSMRRRTPQSAPRLFEWLVNNGYVEPVTTIKSRNRKAGRQLTARRRKSSRK